MIDDRDGKLVYYDVNALSNFVADTSHVIGFDPFANWSTSCNSRRSRNGRRTGPSDSSRCSRTWPIGTPRFNSNPHEGDWMRYGYWLPVFGGWACATSMTKT